MINIKNNQESPSKQGDVNSKQIVATQCNDNEITPTSGIKDIYPFESHFFKIKQYNYHYIDEGEGDPIVMVHGNPTWSFMFRNLISEFSKTHRVIAPDHLGCGLSDKPENFSYNLESHIDNLEAFILSKNLEKITLLVHDWGGPIGLGFAIRHPEKIERVIISNTAAFSMDEIPLRIKLGKMPWLGEKLIIDMNLFVKCATTMTTTTPLSTQVKNGYLLPFQNKSDRTAVYQFVKDIPMSPLHPSIETLLGIEHGLWMLREKPIAIIWGMRDWCFTPKFYERWIDFFPHAESLKLKDAGHLLYEDAIDDIIPFINHFIEAN